MDARGVETRPIRQMAGGASFHQVYLDEVAVADDLRLGAVGQGWTVASAILGSERGGALRLGGGAYRDVLALAQRLGVTTDPRVRQELAALYIGQRTQSFFARRGGQLPAAALHPAARGSIAKLLFTAQLRQVGEVAARLLGARMAADTGAWGTFGWSHHITGAPGTRIAGGSDEIQRNIIAERGLGLPR